MGWCGGRCGGLERSDFEQFLLWEGVEVGVVILKELILKKFNYASSVVVLTGTDFEQFLHWKGVKVGVVVMKELILNSFYFGRV